jgi:hypothetical protein
MNRLTSDQLLEMLAMQTALNITVNPDWVYANYGWGRAIRVECAELSDHLGWKWWKKQEPNYPQAHIEIVNIWHFMLSSTLAGAQGDLYNAQQQINIGLQWPHDEKINLLGKVFTLRNLTLHEKVDILSAFASAGYMFPALLESIMVDVGMTWGDLRRMYLAKNVLNMFRQQNGYKAGTYQKDWGGVEDNVRLEQLLDANPDISAEALHIQLTEIYAGVRGEAAKVAA